MLIRRLEPTAAVAAAAAPYDVLLSFDGVDVANDGTVPFRSGERLTFSYLVSQKYVGETAELRLLHDGEERVVSVRLDAPVRLIPFHIKVRGVVVWSVVWSVCYAVCGVLCLCLSRLLKTQHNKNQTKHKQQQQPKTQKHKNTKQKKRKKGAPPSYFIVAGLVFTPATVPYLRSEYGKEYDYDAPVSVLAKVSFVALLGGVLIVVCVVVVFLGGGGG